jgi:hypothetical protein
MNCCRRVMGLAIAGAFVLLGAACGGGNEQPPVTVDQRQPSAAPPAAPPSQAPPAQPAAAPSAAAPAPAPASPAAPIGDAQAGAAAPAPATGATATPIAVEDSELTGVQVALMELRRTSGDTVTLRIQFRNTTDKDITDSLFYGTSIASRTYLIDGASKKKYLVIVDAENKPVAYVGESSTLKHGATIPAWVRFPAPPPGTATVTVVAPGVPPFEDVPIK